MPSDLMLLLELQEKDMAILEVDRRLEELDTRVEALDEAVRRATEAVAAAGRTAQDAARRRDELEVKIESFRTLQERRRLRLETIRPGKQAAALMAELDLARSVIAKEESDWVRSADAVSGLHGKVAEAEEAVAKLREEQETERRELAESAEALRAEREAMERDREESAGRVQKPLLVRYDRLRQSRAPQVVVALTGSACGACYTAVPLNRRSQMRTGQIDGCEVCGVILYAAEQAD